VRQVRRHLTVLSHLGPATRALDQVAFDALALIGVDGVERVGTQHLGELVEGVVHVHSPNPTPALTNSVRNRFNPERIRLFTVPSGSSNMTATSR
jgi:hypothetical protein